MTSTRAAVPVSTLISWRERIHLGAYTVAEAAWLVETTRQAVGQWRRAAYGAASPHPSRLSYLQLIELAVAVSFRQAGTSIADLRQAHQALRRYSGTEHPFVRIELKTGWIGIVAEMALQAKTLKAAFIRRNGELRWADQLCDRFEQFDYEDNLALRWHLRGREGALVVDPRVAFGAPSILGTGVPTQVIGERFTAGETIPEIADDFGVTRDQIEVALALERTHAVRAA